MVWGWRDSRVGNVDFRAVFTAFGEVAAKAVLFKYESSRVQSTLARPFALRTGILCLTASRHDCLPPLMTVSKVNTMSLLKADSFLLCLSALA